jgi:hypothetical protein
MGIKLPHICTVNNFSPTNKGLNSLLQIYPNEILGNETTFGTDFLKQKKKLKFLINFVNFLKGNVYV